MLSQQAVVVCHQPERICTGYRRVYDLLAGGWSGDAPRVLAALSLLLHDIYSNPKEMPGGRHQAAIRRACALIEQALPEPCAPRRLARQVGLSYETFRKVFRQEIGCAPRSYHMRRRMDHACMLLVSQPNQGLADIAQQLGYADAFAFSAQFKRVIGLAPDHFRQAR